MDILRELAGVTIILSVAVLTTIGLLTLGRWLERARLQRIETALAEIESTERKMEEGSVWVKMFGGEK